MKRYNLASLFLIFMACCCLYGQNNLVNYALNKSYTSTDFHAGNSHGNCADANDVIQLTDGFTSIDQEGDPYFWFRKTSVGWIAKPWIVIEIDLEKVCPVEKVNYTTSTGIHGFFWPKNIYVLTSTDKKKYHLATDMIKDNLAKLPDYASKGIETPILHKIESKELKTKARYIKLVINQLSYIHVSDEIEVLGNPEQMPENQQGIALSGTGKELYTKLKYSSRIFSEMEMFDTRSKELGLDISNSLAEIERDLKKFTTQSLDYKNFSTVVPHTDIDYKMLSINSKLLAKEKVHGIKLWTTNKWDPVNVYSLPENTPLTSKIYLANKERRGKVFNITNSHSKPEKINIKFKTDKGLLDKCDINLRKVLCNDNQMNLLVFNILDEPSEEIEKNSFTIPAGMTQQFWIDFQPKNLPPGKFDVIVEVSHGFFKKTSLQYEINIADFSFPENLTLGLGMWDYITTRTAERYDFSEQQKTDILNIIKEYQYNCPWVSGSILPALDDTYFDSDDNLIKNPDFSEIDEWMSTFPFAKDYYITHLKSQIGSVNTSQHLARYEKRMAAFSKTLNNHLLSENIKQNLYLLPRDEPGSQTQQEEFIKIAQSVKSGLNSDDSKIKIFVDTIHGYPETDAHVYNGDTIYTVSDNICAHHQIFLNFLNRSNSEVFYAEKMNQGKEFSFYSTLTPSKSFDPYTYYLLQQWISFYYGATYSGYWQFYDMPAESTFNDYAIDKLIYSPFYCNDKNVYITKQWKAIHEGRQDYEYLTMLQKKIHNTHAPDLKNSLSETLNQALDNVSKPFIDYYSKEVSMWDANPEIYKTKYHWNVKKDRTASTEYKNKIWQVLNQNRVKETDTAKIYNVSDFGAIANDQLYDSEAINKAILTCSQNGGGTVIIGDGKFLCKPIELKNNVELKLNDETILFFSDDFKDYPIRPVRHEGIEIMGYSALIWASDATNISITGKGTIDGNGKKWWRQYREYKSRYKKDQKLEVIDELHQKIINLNTNRPKRSVGWFFPRPMTIDFRNCINITLKDFTIKDSPFWMIHPTYCENVLISGIKTNSSGPNTDGIDPDSSRNVIIENCFFRNGDDCIAIKSGYNEDGLRVNKPTENVLIRDCVMDFSDASSVAIGSETSGGIRNVMIENCILKNADRAIRIKTSRGRGGIIESIRANNIEISDMKKKVIEISGMYNSSQPEQVNIGTPTLRDIRFSNIKCQSPKADRFCEIMGLVEKPFEDIVFENIVASSKDGVLCVDANNISFINTRLDIKSEKPYRLIRTENFQWNKILSVEVMQ